MTGATWHCEGLQKLRKQTGSLGQAALELRPARWGNRNAKTWGKQRQREPLVKNQGTSLVHLSERRRERYESRGKAGSRPAGQGSSLIWQRPCSVDSAPLCVSGPAQLSWCLTGCAPWHPAVWAMLLAAQLERCNPPTITHLGSRFSPSHNLWEAGVQRQRLGGYS